MILYLEAAVRSVHGGVLLQAVAAMRTPRYEVRSVTGYNALGSGVAGEGKLATTWWVADTWRCYYEVPLQVVDSVSGRGRKWKRYRTRGKTTTRRGVAERNCERLNREHAAWLAA